MEKQKLKKLELKIEQKIVSSSTTFKQRSYNATYHLNNELNPNEKLIEVGNKYDINCYNILFIYYIKTNQ